MPSSVMVELVRREDLCAPEIAIFDVVHRWVQKDPETRSGQAPEITKFLRLPLMSLKEIMKVVRPTGLCDMEQIMEAVDFHSDPEAHAQILESRARILETGGDEPEGGAALLVKNVSPTGHIGAFGVSLKSPVAGGAGSNVVLLSQSQESSSSEAGTAAAVAASIQHQGQQQGVGKAGISGAVTQLPPQYTRRSSASIRSSTGVLWHSELHGPQITISNGGRTVYQASSNWNGVVANHQFKNGIHVRQYPFSKLIWHSDQISLQLSFVW